MLTHGKSAVFTLEIDGVAHDLQVAEFRATEALNRTYAVEIEVVSERHDLDLESFLHRPAFLTFGAANIHLVLPRLR